MSKKSVLIWGWDLEVLVSFSLSVFYRKRRMSGDDACSLLYALYCLLHNRRNTNKKKGMKFWLMLKIKGVILES